MSPAAFSPLGPTQVLLRTLYPSKCLRPCWTELFEHTLICFRMALSYLLRIDSNIFQLFNRPPLPFSGLPGIIQNLWFRPYSFTDVYRESIWGLPVKKCGKKTHRTSVPNSCVYVIFRVAGFRPCKRRTKGNEPFKDSHERARSDIFCLI